MVLNNITSKTNIISIDNGCPTLEWAEKNTLQTKLCSSISMDFSFGPEAIETMSLIHSENKCLNKTIAVFVELCWEVRELNKEGNPLLVKCLLASEELCELFQKNNDNDFNDIAIPASPSQTGRSKIQEISLSPGNIIKISGFLELLFQAQQFTERCFIVISEIVKQFSALFNVETSTYINIDYSSLHFQVSYLCFFIYIQFY